MSHRILLPTLLAFLMFSVAVQAESTDFLPAGMLLNCTLDEPNFSSKTAEVGDPVLCHIGSTSAFGHQVFPRGAYLAGRLQDSKDPGHLYGKGWIALEFDRLVLPGEAVLPLNTKTIAVPHYKVERNGRIDGKGHAKRDAAEWAIPVMWPIKILTLPARGPYPTLKGEQRITLRLMDDVAIPVVPTAAHYVPMPPWARSNGGTISDSTLVSSNYTIRHAAAEVRHFPDPGPVAIKPEAVVFAGEKEPTLLVLRDHSAYVAQSYWLDGDAIRCVTADGNSTLIPIANIDLAESVRLNRQRKIAFDLRPQSISPGMQ